MASGKSGVWSVERGVGTGEYETQTVKKKIIFPNQIPHAPLQQIGTLTINATSHLSQPCQCGKTQGERTGDRTVWWGLYSGRSRIFLATISHGMFRKKDRQILHVVRFVNPHVALSCGIFKSKNLLDFKKHQ